MQRALIASFAAAAVAAPLNARQAQSAAPPGGDVTILNYALTLEHLENTFYREALERFGPEDFQSIGLDLDFYNNLQQVAADEAAHVQGLTDFISGADGTPVAECTYDFQYTDIQGFMATANVLEGVGVSAYLGAAGVVADPSILTVAGSVLTVEARHSSYIRNVQEPPQSPFPAPYDIPLNFRQVFTLAGAFITGCPAGPTSSLELGVMGYPAISVAPAGTANIGDELTLTVAQPEEGPVTVGGAWFITFPAGPVSVDVATGNQVDYVVTVPAEAQAGQAYIVLTSDDQTPTDANVVAGPAVFQIADNAAAFQAANPGFVYRAANCDKKDGGKPDEPKQPTYPGKDTPKSPEAPKYPTKDDKPKHPETPKSPEAPKDYPKHEPKQPEHKPTPPEYKPHEPEHKPEPKEPVHKQPVYPAEPEHKPEQKPEDCPEEEKPKTY